ncbi:hypothetical protein BKI52_37440 [marine bacterium AO1-C]|nr:hypothetical protein BKI52_37440 [marine bacterium AO1-C]
MKFSISETIIVFGIFQAIVLSIALLFKKENRQANQFLALLCFCMGYSNFIYIVVQFRLFDRFFWLHLLPYGLAFVIGPSFYFYIRSLTSPSFKFQRKHWPHFYLIAIDYIHSVYHLIVGRIPPPSQIQLHAVIDELSNLGSFSLIFYIVLSWRLLKKHQEDLPQQLSYTDQMALQWLRKFVVAMTVIVAIASLYSLAKVIFDFYSREAYFYRFLPVVIISWLGLLGLQQKQAQVDIDISPNETPKLATSVSASPQLNEHIAQLKQVLEQEKLYLNPELSLRILQDKTQLTAKEISTALNQGLQKNFYLFVNEYRVEEAKRRLLDPNLGHLTIFGIATEAGFKSKATFNRLFKSITGLTPKQYREQEITPQ